MTLREIYTEHIRDIESCVKEKDIDNGFVINHALLIGTNAIARQTAIMNALSAADNVKYDIIAQQGMLEKGNALKPRYSNIFIWDSDYTIDITDKLKAIYDKEYPDSVLFYSWNPISVRNLNLYQICRKLHEAWECSVYSYDINGSLFEYINVRKLCYGLEAYKAINDYLLN